MNYDAELQKAAFLLNVIYPFVSLKLLSHLCLLAYSGPFKTYYKIQINSMKEKNC